MKTYALVFSVALSSVAHASHNQLNRGCDGLGRQLDNTIRRSTQAAVQAGRDLDEISNLSSALERAAQLVGAGGGSVNLTQELNPLVSDSENTVRSSQNGLRHALSELRRTMTDPNLGSQVRPIAGRAADVLENAKATMIDAANRVAATKTRISQLHVQLGNNSQLDSAKREIDSGLRGLRSLERDLSELSVLRNLSADARDYTRSCSDLSDINCSAVRDELNRSADRCTQDERELSRASSDISLVQRQIERLSGQLGGGGSNVDINAALNGFIDREVLPALQDSANNLHNAMVTAREASHEESGVGFDRLVRDHAIPSAEKAERLANSGLTGLSNLRSQIASLAAHIGNGGSSSAQAGPLRQAARELDRLGRGLERSISGLSGGQWGSGGDLREVSRALDSHRRLCELR